MDKFAHLVFDENGLQTEVFFNSSDLSINGSIVVDNYDASKLYKIEDDEVVEVTYSELIEMRVKPLRNEGVVLISENARKAVVGDAKPLQLNAWLMKALIIAIVADRDSDAFKALQTSLLGVVTTEVEQRNEGETAQQLMFDVWGDKFAKFAQATALIDGKSHADYVKLSSANAEDVEEIISDVEASFNEMFAT